MTTKKNKVYKAPRPVKLKPTDVSVGVALNSELLRWIDYRPLVVEGKTIAITSRQFCRLGTK